MSTTQVLAPSVERRITSLVGLRAKALKLLNESTLQRNSLAAEFVAAQLNDLERQLAAFRAQVFCSHN